MEDIKSKAAAKIGIVFSVISFGFIIAGLIVSVFETPPESGVSRSFGLWIYSVIVAYIAMIPYFVDAMKDIIRACEKVDTLYNLVLALVLLGGIPMCVFVGGGLGINILFWNLYHLLMVVMEIISIRRNKSLQISQKSN